MSSPYQSRFGSIARDPVNVIVQDGVEDISSGIHAHGGMQKDSLGVPSEPVTPPATGGGSNFYSKKPTFSASFQTPSNSGAMSQPQSFPGAGLSAFTYGPGSLASPLETPTATPYTPKQQGYVASPYTPHSGASNSTSSGGGAVSGVPINTLYVGASRYGFVPPQATQAVSSANTAQPSNLGHARSYSYSPTDLQPALKRLSLSAGSSASTDTFRPRAYSSSGVSAQPGSQIPQGPSGNIELATSYPFPAPLSSPISPGNNGQTGAHMGQRPYPQVFMRTLSEEQLTTQAATPLRRSMSSVSASGGLYEAHEETTSVGGVGTTGGGGAGLAASSARRQSPPHYGRYYRPRRSSSSSSADAAAGASANANPGLGAGVNAPGSPPGGAGAANIDIASASDSQIYALCKDQRGCRYLQRKLSEHDPFTIRRVFDSTHPHIVTLMMDPFGNYFCQKLFDYCNPDEVTVLLRVAAPSLPSIAVNQHGTRALQKLIDAVNTSEQVDIIVQALDGNVVRLIRDLNGNHVVQKLLLNLDESSSQFIYEAMCNAVVEVGSHRHGCCVLQRCLDHAQDYNRHRLVAHIVAQALALVCDPFGNYVCQYVIDLGVDEYTNSLVEQLLGKIALLSVQKFSSNVVEKCLRAATPPLQRALVMEIMIPRTLHELLLDNYGNYVIQTALEATGATDPAMKQQLAASVQTALITTRSPYGRRIMSKLKA